MCYVYYFVNRVKMLYLKLHERLFNGVSIHVFFYYNFQEALDLAKVLQLRKREIASLIS